VVNICENLVNEFADTFNFHGDPVNLFDSHLVEVGCCEFHGIPLKEERQVGRLLPSGLPQR
jgi:hypothetical protein